MMNLDLNLKANRVLHAALTCFKQYGFKRTSMDDIAKSADMSRPALYLLFKNKTDIFRSIATQYHELTLSNAQNALQSDEDIQTRITNAITIRKLPLYALTHGSPHGPELFDVTMSTAADINARANETFQNYMTEALESALNNGDIFTNDISPRELVQIIYAGAFGLQTAAANEDHYAQLLSKMINTLFNGLKSNKHNK